MVYQVFVQTPTKTILLGSTVDPLRAIDDYAEEAVKVAPKTEMWTLGVAKEIPNIKDRMGLFSDPKRYAKACWSAAGVAARKERKHRKAHLKLKHGSTE